MKKILSIFLCIVFPIASNAQDIFESAEHPYRPQSTYGSYVKPGVHPYLRTGVSCNDYTSMQVRGIKSVWGFAAEAGVDFFFTDTYFGIKPALRYITKGAKASWTQGDPANTKIYQQTLELPLDVTVNFRLSDDATFQVGMGPYFAYGMGGTTYCDNRSYATFGGMGTMEIREFDVGCGLVCYSNFGCRGGLYTRSQWLCRSGRTWKKRAMAAQPFFLSDAWLRVLTPVVSKRTHP